MLRFKCTLASGKRCAVHTRTPHTALLYYHNSYSVRLGGIGLKSIAVLPQMLRLKSLCEVSSHITYTISISTISTISSSLSSATRVPPKMMPLHCYSGGSHFLLLRATLSIVMRDTYTVT